MQYSGYPEDRQLQLKKFILETWIMMWAYFSQIEQMHEWDCPVTMAVAMANMTTTVMNHPPINGPIKLTHNFLWVTFHTLTATFHTAWTAAGTEEIHLVGRFSLRTAWPPQSSNSLLLVAGAKHSLFYLWLCCQIKQNCSNMTDHPDNDWQILPSDDACFRFLRSNLTGTKSFSSSILNLSIILQQLNQNWKICTKNFTCKNLVILKLSQLTDYLEIKFMRLRALKIFHVSGTIRNITEMPREFVYIKSDHNPYSCPFLWQLRPIASSKSRH